MLSGILPRFRYSFKGWSPELQCPDKNRDPFSNFQGESICGWVTKNRFPSWNVDPSWAAQSVKESRKDSSLDQESRINFLSGTLYRADERSTKNGHHNWILGDLTLLRWRGHFNPRNYRDHWNLWSSAATGTKRHGTLKT